MRSFLGRATKVTKNLYPATVDGDGAGQKLTTKNGLNTQFCRQTAHNPVTEPKYFENGAAIECGAS